MVDGVLVLQSLVDGTVMGALYALVAVGLTLIFGVMRMVNFAHGDFLMVSMYATLVLVQRFGVDPYAAIPFTVALLVVGAVLFYKLVLGPSLDGPVLNQLLITLGVGIVLENTANLIFTSNPQAVNVAYATHRLAVGVIGISYPRLYALLAGASSVLVLYWVLYRTELGRMLRAAAQDRDAAALMGINVQRMYMIALGIGFACLGVAGPVLTPILYTMPTIGVLFTVLAFIVVVLGGLGSFSGALIGGLAIGIIEALGRSTLPGTYGEIPPYVVFVLILLFRPQGLFGARAG